MKLSRERKETKGTKQANREHTVEQKSNEETAALILHRHERQAQLGVRHVSLFCNSPLVQYSSNLMCETDKPHFHNMLIFVVC